jgi:hypothetical protein
LNAYSKKSWSSELKIKFDFEKDRDTDKDDGVKYTSWRNQEVLIKLLAMYAEDNSIE